MFMRYAKQLLSQFPLRLLPLSVLCSALSCCSILSCGHFPAKTTERICHTSVANAQLIRAQKKRRSRSSLCCKLQMLHVVAHKSWGEWGERDEEREGRAGQGRVPAMNRWSCPSGLLLPNITAIKSLIHSQCSKQRVQRRHEERVERDGERDRVRDREI